MEHWSRQGEPQHDFLHHDDSHTVEKGDEIWLRYDRDTQADVVQGDEGDHESPSGRSIAHMSSRKKSRFSSWCCVGQQRGFSAQSEDQATSEFTAMLAEADFDKATPRHEANVPHGVTRNKVVRMFTKAETLTQLKSMSTLLCLKEGDECWWDSDDYPSKIKTVCKYDHSVWTPIHADMQAPHERSEDVPSDDTVYTRARPFPVVIVVSLAPGSSSVINTQSLVIISSNLLVFPINKEELNCMDESRSILARTGSSSKWWPCTPTTSGGLNYRFHATRAMESMPSRARTASWCGVARGRAPLWVISTFSTQ